MASSVDGDIIITASLKLNDEDIKKLETGIGKNLSSAGKKALDSYKGLSQINKQLEGQIGEVAKLTSAYNTLQKTVERLGNLESPLSKEQVANPLSVEEIRNPENTKKILDRFNHYMTDGFDDYRDNLEYELDMATNEYKKHQAALQEMMDSPKTLGYKGGRKKTEEELAQDKKTIEDYYKRKRELQVSLSTKQGARKDIIDSLGGIYNEKTGGITKEGYKNLLQQYGTGANLNGALKSISESTAAIKKYDEEIQKTQQDLNNLLATYSTKKNGAESNRAWQKLNSPFTETEAVPKPQVAKDWQEQIKYTKSVVEEDKANVEDLSRKLDITKKIGATGQRNIKNFQTALDALSKNEDKLIKQQKNLNSLEDDFVTKTKEAAQNIKESSNYDKKQEKGLASSVSEQLANIGKNRPDLASSKDFTETVNEFNKEALDAEVKTSGLEIGKQFAKNFFIGFGKDAVSIIKFNAGRLARTIVQQSLAYTKQLYRALGKVALQIKNATQQAMKFVGTKILDKMPEFVKNLIKGQRPLQNLTKYIKQFVLSGLGIRTLYTAFRKFWSMMQEGFKVLAQLDAETNKAASAIMTAVNQLQNQLGALGGVFVTNLYPYIVQFINLINKAVEAITRFFAALFGRTSYKRAIAVQKDYAASLGKTGKAADDAAQSLAAFDEINTLTTKDANKGGGGGGAGSGITGGEFEDVPIDEKFREMVQSEDWSELGKTIANKFADAMENIPWDKIEEATHKFAKRFSSLLNGIFATERMWKDLGITIGKGINVATDFIDTFVDLTKWSQFGKDIAIALRNSVTTINWSNLGKTLTNKLKMIQKTLHGFVEEWTSKDAIYFGTALSTMVTSAFNNVDWAQFPKDIAKFFTRINETISQFIKNTPWKDFVSQISNGIQNTDWSPMFDSLTEVFKSIADIDWSYIGTMIGKAINKVLSSIPWDKWIPDFVDFGIGIFQGLANALHAIKWDAIVEKVKTGIKNANWKDLINSIGDLTATFVEYGAELIKAIIDGFTEAVPHNGDTWKNFIKTLKKSLKDSFKELSKSWDELEPYIEDLINAVFDAAEPLITDIVSFALEHSMKQGFAIAGNFITHHKMLFFELLALQSLPQLFISLIQSGFKAAFSNPAISGAILEGLGTLGKTVGGGIADLFTTLGGTVTECGSFLLAGFTDVGAQITALGGAGEALSAPISSLFTTAEGAVVAGGVTVAVALAAAVVSWNLTNFLVDAWDSATGPTATSIKKFFGATDDEIEYNAAYAETWAEKSFGEKMSDFWDGIVYLTKNHDWGGFLADFIGKPLVEGTKSIKECFTNLSTDTDDLQDNVGHSFKKLDEKFHILDSIKEFFSGVSSDLKTIIDKNVSNFETFWTNIKTIFTNIYEFWKSIIEFIITLWNTFKTFVETFWNTVVAFFRTTFGQIKEIWKGTGTFFEKIGQTFKTIWENIKGFAQIFATAVTGIFEDFHTNISTALNNIKDKFITVFTSIKDGLKHIINGIIGIINKMISGVVTGINNMTGALNKLGFDTPGGGHVGFNIGKITAPQIPALAKGAVLPANKPFLAQLGDQKYGTNIEAPLDTITEAVVKAFSQMYNMNMGGSDSEQPINIYIGNELLDTVIAKSQQRRTLRSGGR